MSTMEVEHNSLTNPSEGNPVIGGDESEQKGLVLDELLQEELKGEDSVDCFIKRARVPGDDGSEFNLNYEDASIVSSSAFYSPKEESTDNNSSSLEKEFDITLNSTEVHHNSNEDKPKNEEHTKEDTFVTTPSVEKTDENVKENGKDGDNLNKISSDSLQGNETESSITNEEKDSEIDKELNVQNAPQEIVNEVQDSAASIVSSEMLSSDEINDSTVPIPLSEMSSEILSSDSIYVSTASEAPSEIQNSISTAPEAPSETQNSESTALEAPSEIQKSESTAPEASSETQNSESTVLEVPSEIQTSISTALEIPSEIQNSKATALEAPSEIQNSDEMLVDASEVQLPSETVNTDEMDVLSAVQPSSEIMNSDERKNSSGLEVPSQMLSCNTEQNETDTNNGDDAKVEGTAEVRKDVLYLVFQPKEQVNKKNDEGKTNDGEHVVQCNEDSASNGSIIVNTTGIDTPAPAKPITKTLITIGGNVDTKAGKELSKSIIVKKITAKVIKSGNTKVTRRARGEVQDETSVQENASTAKFSEAEEKPHTKSPDPVEFDGLEKTKDDDVANASPGKKLRLFRKLDPKVSQERKPHNFEDMEAPDVDTQDDHTNVIQGEDMEASEVDTQDDHTNIIQDEEDPVLENGSSTEVNTKTQINNKENHVSGKGKGATKKRKESTGKQTKTTSFEAVKRKFEEIYKESREEEGTAIKEIKKMKKETLDVLKKINAEMEKLKKAFVAGN